MQNTNTALNVLNSQSKNPLTSNISEIGNLFGGLTQASNGKTGMERAIGLGEIGTALASLFLL